jgi:hypothetical protein
MTTLKVFEIMLQKNSQVAVHDLVLRHLKRDKYVAVDETPVTATSPENTDAPKVGTKEEEIADDEGNQFSIAGDSSEEEDSKSKESNAAEQSESDAKTAEANEITPHRIVNFYLTLLPEDAKSSYQTGDSGYDTYLRDASRQVR